jgi:uncharacterized protein (DUF362 family)/ferredoxin
MAIADVVEISAGAEESVSRSCVALVRCSSYDEAAVDEAVARGLALLGGAGQFVAPGEQILLKPNLLVASAPEQAVTTHPAVFRAVARQLQASGATLSYGDSPGVEIRPGAAARRSGLAAVADDLGIAMADFSTGETVSFPEGHLIKQFTIASGVLAADGIVSLPKMKSHGLTRFTGAIKNQFGCIPGMLKPEFHARLSDPERFSQMLVDLNLLLRPRLYVMDGIVAMEGNGPRSGTPRQVSALLFSTDPVALDGVACRIVNLDPELVPPLRWGEAWELGRIAAVDTLGDPLESFVVPDFEIDRRPVFEPHQRGMLGAVLKNLVVPRPTVVAENCTRCGTCVEVCPVSPKAIDFVNRNGHKEPPQHDYGSCIRCYCCQEMCPFNAIVIETPLLGRLIHH